jgi:putative ABC transport system permease protein
VSGADRSALLARTHVGVRELVAEAVAGVGQRPLRSTLTGLGAAIGVCAVVAVLGLTATASAQVNERFDELRAREVSVRPVDADDGRNVTVAALDAADAGRVAALPGVVAAGTVAIVPLEDTDVRSLPGTEPAALGVHAVSASAWDVLRIGVRAGRVYDVGHEQRADRVVVLGVGAADRLGVHRLDAAPAVFVNGVAFTVVGVVDDVGRAPDLLGAIMMPPTTAAEVWAGDDAEARTELLVETQVGAATVIAAHLPYLLDPVHPEALRVDAPPDPEALGSSIGGDLDVLSLALAAVSVALGALGISNTMLVTVMERVHEIGLRRALGAGGGHIGVQFIVEAAVLGGIGGLVGSGVGVLAVVATAAVRDWTPVLASWVVVAAPLLGLVSGLVAGVFPALRAARVQPADALRR